MREQGRQIPDIVLGPVNPVYKADELERRMRTSRVSRRIFISTAGSLIAGAVILHFSGYEDEAFDKLAGRESGPTSEQRDVYKHLVQEKFDVISGLTIIGVEGFPSKMRNRPYTARENGGYGEVKIKVDKNTWVGDGYVVLGNAPKDPNNKKNMDPWIGVVSPKCDRLKGVSPNDVLFSHYDNFKMNSEQYQKFLEIVQRKYGLIWS